MLILTQFLFRLAFGLSLSMALTSPRKVTSGYFRNHLYVLLGLNVLATLVALAAQEQFRLWPPLVGACLSYAGAVVWLYEKPRVGIALLAMVALGTIVMLLESRRIRVERQPMSSTKPAIPLSSFT